MMVPPEAEMCLWYPEDNFFLVTFARILSEQKMLKFTTYLNQKLFVVPKPGKRVLFFVSFRRIFNSLF
jgi:hypothetical protein